MVSALFCLFERAAATQHQMHLQQQQRTCRRQAQAHRPLQRSLAHHRQLGIRPTLLIGFGPRKTGPTVESQLDAARQFQVLVTTALPPRLALAARLTVATRHTDVSFGDKASPVLGGVVGAL